MAYKTLFYELIGGPLDGEVRRVPGRDSHYTFPFCRGGLHTYAVRPRPVRDTARQTLRERDCLVYLPDRAATHHW